MNEYSTGPRGVSAIFPPVSIFLRRSPFHLLKFRNSQRKAIRPEIRIVTLTGYNSRELEMKIRKQGIIYYMIKPIDTKILKALVDHISQKYLNFVDNT